MSDTRLEQLYQLAKEGKAFIRTHEDAVTEGGARVSPYPELTEILERLFAAPSPESAPCHDNRTAEEYAKCVVSESVPKIEHTYDCLYEGGSSDCPACQTAEPAPKPADAVRQERPTGWVEDATHCTHGKPLSETCEQCWRSFWELTPWQRHQIVQRGLCDVPSSSVPPATVQAEHCHHGVAKGTCIKCGPAPAVPELLQAMASTHNPDPPEVDEGEMRDAAEGVAKWPEPATAPAGQTLAERIAADPEIEAHVRAAHQEIAEGKGIPHEEAMRILREAVPAGGSEPPKCAICGQWEQNFIHKSGHQFTPAPASSGETPEQLRNEAWQLAACGGHSNRYGEDDAVWDASCVRCATRHHAITEYAAAFARSTAREALEPFARLLKFWEDHDPGQSDKRVIYGEGGRGLTFGDLRRAKSAYDALSGAKTGKGEGK